MSFNKIVNRKLLVLLFIFIIAFVYDTFLVMISDSLDKFLDIFSHVFSLLLLLFCYALPVSIIVESVIQSRAKYSNILSCFLYVCSGWGLMFITIEEMINWKQVILFGMGGFVFWLLDLQILKRQVTRQVENVKIATGLYRFYNIVVHLMVVVSFIGLVLILFFRFFMFHPPQ